MTGDKENLNFPRWENTNWVIYDKGKTVPDPNNSEYFEYFDKLGKLQGLVKPYGTIFAAYEYKTNATTGKLEIVLRGCFFTREQAQADIERLVRYKYSPQSVWDQQ